MLDKKECAALLTIIDRIVETSKPQRAEYFRGYHQGIQVHARGVSEERADDHHMLIDYSVLGSGDPYIDSYTRGYRDGFEGMAPEGPSLASSSSLIAYIL